MITISAVDRRNARLAVLVEQAPAALSTEQGRWAEARVFTEQGAGFALIVRVLTESQCRRAPA